MIAIADYKTGNLRSVENALRRAGADYVVTDDCRLIGSAERVILPGVGEASGAMRALSESGLSECVRSLTVPVLGICIGMQLMCRHSDEGDTDCMGIFDTEVRLLEADPLHGIKVPEMGWNRIEQLSGPLFKGIDDGQFVYFVHSYAPQISSCTVARTRHGVEFSAALQRDNFFGTQFHPEKSGAVGARIIENFLTL